MFRFFGYEVVDAALKRQFAVSGQMEAFFDALQQSRRIGRGKRGRRTAADEYAVNHGRLQLLLLSIALHLRQQIIDVLVLHRLTARILEKLQ